MNQSGKRQTLRDDELDPALAEVSRAVIGSSIEIHKSLGPGFDAGVYEQALSAELKKQGVEHDLDYKFDVEYAGQTVGTARVSLYVAERFVVRVLDSPDEVGGLERDSLRGLIKNADLDMGLIINFCRKRLRDGLVRVLNPERIDAIRGESAHGDED